MDTNAHSHASDERRHVGRRLEDLTRTVLEASPMPLFVKDAEGRFVLVNSAAAELFGVSVEELLGRTEDDVFPPDVARAHRAEDRSVLDERSCFRGEETLGGLANGHVSTFLVRKVSTHDARGQPLVVCTMTDVRALKVAEARDAETTAILHSVLDSSEAAIYSVDRGYRYTSFNTAQALMVRELFGTEAVLHAPVHQGLPPSEWVQLKPHLDRALAGESFVTDLHTGSASTLRTYEVSYRPVRALDDLVSGVAVFARDTTDRRVAEAALEATEERLRQAQKMDAVGRLAGGVAHDLNNMLTVVLSSVSFMQSAGATDGPFTRDLEEIARAAERARALTAQLLSFSRRQPVNPVTFDVNARLTELSQLLKRIIGEDVQVELELGAGIGPVSADPSAFDQALMNLIVNARDAMPQGGTIVVRTGDAVLRDGKLMPTACPSERTHTMISVSDTGVGMTPEVLEHLFEPFFTTKEKGKGTGLGLAIVYGAVRQAHGDIEVSSRPGRGTTFNLFFPVATAVLRPRPSAPPRFLPARPGERVLLVEDDPQVKSAAARALGLFGYQVTPAGSLGEALAALEASTSWPTVLVTDVVLPEHDGLAVARAVQERVPGIPVLFMSGFPEEVLSKHGLPPGARMLQKPFTPETLGRRVRQVIDAAATPQPMSPA